MQGYLVISGSPTVQNLISFNRLVDWGERERSQPEIVAGLAPDLAPVAVLRAFAPTPAAPGQRIRSQPVEMFIPTRPSYLDLHPTVAHHLPHAAVTPPLPTHNPHTKPSLH